MQLFIVGKLHVIISQTHEEVQEGMQGRKIQIVTSTSTTRPVSCDIECGVTGRICSSILAILDSGPDSSIHNARVRSIFLRWSAGEQQYVPWVSVAVILRIFVVFRSTSKFFVVHRSPSSYFVVLRGTSSNFVVFPRASSYFVVLRRPS